MNIDDFLDFEMRNQLFEDELGGIKYWHIIRKHIYDEIMLKKTDIGAAHKVYKSDSILYRVIQKGKQIPDIIIKSPVKLKEKNALIICHHRRIRADNFFKCIYTDELIPELNLSYYVLEDPMVDFHFKPAFTNKLKYTDYIHNKYIIIRILRKLFKKSILSKKEQNKIYNLIGILNENFNENVNAKRMEKFIENSILKYHVFFKSFNKIIGKVNPKVIIEVVSYDFSRVVINDVAKKYGIPTVELQHGTMGKYHIAYNFAEKRDLSTFPDYVFTFGDFWKENTRLPIDDDKIKVVGWPYYEQKVKEFKRQNINNDKKTILFISQGTIGKELSKVAVELSEMINKDEYRVLYKLHPGEYARWRKEYPWLIGADLEVIDNNENDMHYYLAQSDVQVGVYSTAIFEGLGYGLSTYIVKLFGHEYMEELYKNNYTSLVVNAREIIDQLEQNINKSNTVNVNYLWENNSFENIINEINIIIQNQGKG